MRNKKGTHVGIILSFVIFVGFLLFAAIFLQPSTKTDKGKLESLETLKRNIEKETSASTILLIGKSDSKAGCYVLQESFLDLGDKTNVSVIDDQGNDIDWLRDSGNLYFEANGLATFYKIYYSDKRLEEHISQDEMNGCTTFNSSFIDEKTQISEQGIIDIVNRVGNDYDSLKIDLNLAPDEDFGISFNYTNGTSLGEDVSEATSSIKSNVFIKKFQVTYLSYNSNLTTGEFIIYTW